MQNLLFSLSFIFCALFSLATTAQDDARARVRAPTRLILAISIDQMRYDYLTRFGPLFQDGFKTLLERGAVFSEARYRHANTETGPGHAVLMSGRHGSHSGIIANGWYDSLLKKWVNVVDDQIERPVGGKGRAASPANFIGFTLGDALKANYPGARVFGVSAKDRAAILMSGKKADGAFWFEKSDGSYITSSYYMKDAPAWLKTWNAQHFADQFFGKAWNRLLPRTSLYEKFAGVDAAAGEFDGQDIVFPHGIKGNKGDATYYDNFLRTPYADEMILEVAKLIRSNYHLGERETPDMLTVGFSATDIIGHAYGPDSQEMMDQMLRLDQVLGKLLAEVDAKVGLANTLVVLSADHGVLGLIERLAASGLPARRVSSEKLKKNVEASLASRFGGVQGLVAYADPPNFWLDKEVIRAHGLTIEDVEDAIMASLKATGDFETVYRQADFFKDVPALDPEFVLHRNSFFATRSPDISARAKEYVYVADHPGGTGHGTAHEYDRHVPIIFMGQGIASGLYKADCGPEDIAPTIAMLLGISYPKEDDARLLKEMLR